MDQPYNNYLNEARIKFIYSEKAAKFCKIFILLLTCTTLDKSKVKISQNFVVFSNYMNFTHRIFFFGSVTVKITSHGRFLFSFFFCSDNQLANGKTTISSNYLPFSENLNFIEDSVKYIMCKIVNKSIKLNRLVFLFCSL